MRLKLSSSRTTAFWRAEEHGKQAPSTRETKVCGGINRKDDKLAGRSLTVPQNCSAWSTQPNSSSHYVPRLMPMEATPLWQCRSHQIESQMSHLNR